MGWGHRAWGAGWAGACTGGGSRRAASCTERCRRTWPPCARRRRRWAGGCHGTWSGTSRSTWSAACWRMALQGPEDARQAYQAASLQQRFRWTGLDVRLPPRKVPRCAFLEGFSLHANTHLHANDAGWLHAPALHWDGTAPPSGQPGSSAQDELDVLPWRLRPWRETAAISGPRASGPWRAGGTVGSDLPPKASARPGA